LGMPVGETMHQGCWRGTSPPRKFKHYDKGMALRLLYQRRDGSWPAWLDDIPPPHAREHFADIEGPRFFHLYLRRFAGIEMLRAHFDDVDLYDLDLLDTMSLAFMERYNTNFTQYLPSDLRPGVLAAFHEAGLAPYSELDWAELDALRNFKPMLKSGRDGQREPAVGAGQAGRA
jgi:hypothetical protein